MTPGQRDRARPHRPVWAAEPAHVLPTLEVAPLVTPGRTGRDRPGHGAGVSTRDVGVHRRPHTLVLRVHAVRDDPYEAHAARVRIVRGGWS